MKVAIKDIGTIEGEYIILDDKSFEEVIKRFKSRPKTVVLPKVPSSGSLSFPTLGAQIKTASGALKRAVQASLSGERVKAPDEVIESRKAICESCEDLINGRCRLCSCYYKLKITLATEACPVKKWERIENVGI